MKKLYLLLAASMLLCGTTMAQFATKAQNDANICKGEAIKALKHKPNLQKDEETPLWSYDFEEEGATLIEGNDETDGKTHWQIVSLSTFPSNLVTSSGAYFQPFIYRGDTLSDTPDHWAMVNLLGTHAQFGGTGQVAEAAWMEFEMDLTAAQHPMICFNQIYRPLNTVKAYVNVSVDGGDTWTEHLVNEKVESNEYGKLNIHVHIYEAAGVDRVKVRFKMTAEANQLPGYGWQIDDIKIVEAPQYNITLSDARISKFGYIDYRDAEYLAQVWPDAAVSTAAAQQGMTNDEFRRQRAYQINDPMAQSPREQWFTANGIAAFNVEVMNDGYTIVRPKANVKITDPDGEVVFDKTVDAYKNLAVVESDTIDFGTIDEENLDNSTIFFFNTDDINTIKLGRYDVKFKVFIDGQTDSDTTDNVETQYFYITDNNYAMTYDAPRRNFRFDSYQSSASGDEYGTEFTYYFQPDNIMTTDVFIDSTTTVGTAIQIKLYEYVEGESEGSWVNRRTSDVLAITEANLGNWVTLDFTDEYEIPTINDENRYHTALVAVKGTWSNNQQVSIGSDNTLTCYGHNSMGCFRSSGSTADTWYYGFDQLAIRFHKINGDAVETFSMNDIEMYPNPTSGIVNFNNVENATIEVYNMMGQVVARVNSTNDNATIDLSAVANGNYVVRIVKDGAIATSKLNIVK
jgi:hypothetical protein